MSSLPVELERLDQRKSIPAPSAENAGPTYDAEQTSRASTPESEHRSLMKRRGECYMDCICSAASSRQSLQSSGTRAGGDPMDEAAKVTD